MSVRCTQLVMMADTRVGGLIQTFPRVVRLELSWTSLDNNRRVTADDVDKISFTPFQNFSSTLKSLHTAALFLPYRQIFNLVLSSPLLEELTLSGRSLLSSDGDDSHGSQTMVSLIPPALTGSLELHVLGGVGYPTRRLLGLPGGLHFRKLALSLFQEDDIRWITELVARCVDTLECLDVDCHPPCAFVLVLR